MNGINPRRLVATTLKKTDLSDNVIGDQTGGVEFYYQVPADNQVDINSLSVQMECATDRGTGFGSGTALSNGFKLEIQDDEGNTLLDLTKGGTVTTNDSLLLLVDGNVSEDTAVYFGTRYYKADYSSPIKLRNGMKFVLIANDVLTNNVTKLHFFVTGMLKDPV
jgi:hypothetical protein